MVVFGTWATGVADELSFLLFSSYRRARGTGTWARRLGHLLRVTVRSMLPALFLLFIIAPVAEIFVLIKVGSVIGAMPTIAVVIGTALIGAAMLRAQGVDTLRRLQTELTAGGLPAVTLVEGAGLLLAGALLLTPGFITDAIGFTLLVPPLRRLLATRIVARLQMTVLSSLRQAQVHERAASAIHEPPGGSSLRDKAEVQKQKGRTIEGEVEPLDRR